MMSNVTYFSNLCVNGGSYGIAASAVEYSPDLPTYLRITDINDDGTINKDGLKSVDDPKSKKYYLSPNDIVFARTGASTGRNYFYDGSDGKFVYAGFLIKFSIDPAKANPLFVKYYCQSKCYYDWVASFNTGSTRGNINAQTLGNMPIPVLARDQQDLIADTLSALDARIAENKKINHHLEQMAQAIFDEAFPSMALGNSTIGEFISPKRGRNLLSKDAVFGDVPVVAGGLNPSTYHNAANTVAPVITISASGANAGFVNLWNIPVWSSDSSYIDSKMTPYVYFWYVLIKKRQKEIYDAQTGSAQPHIYPQHIEALPIADLNLCDVKELNDKLTPLFLAIGNNIAENSRLADIRDTLLPRLMSGELLTSEAAK